MVVDTFKNTEAVESHKCHHYPEKALDVPDKTQGQEDQGQTILCTTVLENLVTDFRQDKFVVPDLK